MEAVLESKAAGFGWKDVVAAAWQFLSRWLLTIPMILLGLPLVALGLLFRREYPQTRMDFSVYPGQWMLVRLPAWLLPWDNVIDGMWGDKRGWWHNHSGDCTSFLNMWWWAAVRNPANYFKRFWLTCDVREVLIEKLAGQDYVRDDLDDRSLGYQFLRATDEDGKAYYRFYWVHRWGQSDRALVVQLGYKFRMEHAAIDYAPDDDGAFKGFTFEVNPAKDIS